MSDLPSLAIGAVVGVVITLLVMLLRQPFRDRVVRRDALLRSRAVIAGKVVEQLTPYLPDFPFNPKDARFLGSPVDLVVFDGLDEGTLRRVVFVEVKTSSAMLTARERELRDAVKARRVEWMELRSEFQ
jgi:predicted Holliday junction resolvase-like endonuclease